MGGSVIPDWGFCAIPYAGLDYPHNSAMRPRDVLAANLKKLMAGMPELSTFTQITKAGGGSNGTLDRIRRKTTGTSVDNLEPLADVYGLEPWQLLLESLTVEDGQVKGIPRHDDMGLTPEALRIAQWFDKLTDPIERAVAETGAMGVILRVLQHLPPTDTPWPGAQAETPREQVPPPAPAAPPKPSSTRSTPAGRSTNKAR
jgi:hypothetical protein